MGILDRFTSIDDLLVELLERIGGVTEEDTHFFSYPNDGTRATITVGTTKLDFMAGTVMTPAGVVADLGNSLRARGREYCRSLSLQADRDIIIQIGTKSKIPVFAGTWFKVAHLRFTDINIIAAEDTRMFVIACTNPDSIEMAGETYVKDPVDIWGELTTIGNAELAVRTHAPPLPFDRRGDIIRWTDFESATPNYETTLTGNGVFHRSTDVACTGDFCGKMHSSATGGTIKLVMSTNDFKINRLGVGVMFTTTSASALTRIGLTYFTGTKRYEFFLRCDGNGDTYIRDDVLDDTYIGTADKYLSNTSFSSLKCVADIESLKYVRGLVYGHEYDLTEYTGKEYADATAPRIECSVYSHINPALAFTTYIDNIILTENEPI